MRSSRGALLGTRLAILLTLLAAGAGAARPLRHPPRHGNASIHGQREVGRRTASDERMSPRRMTAAGKTLPLGTRAVVRNRETGRAARGTINDRGPHVAGRIVDVTPKVADAIGLKEEDGVAPVTVTPVSVPDDPPK